MSDSTKPIETPTAKSKDPQILIEVKTKNGVNIDAFVYVDLWVYNTDNQRVHCGLGYSAGRVNTDHVTVVVDFYYDLDEWKTMSDHHDSIRCGYHVIFRDEHGNSRIVYTEDEVVIEVHNDPHVSGVSKNSFSETNTKLKDKQPKLFFANDGSGVIVRTHKDDNYGENAVPGHSQRVYFQGVEWHADVVPGEE